MIVLALGIAALLVNWLVVFPVAAATVLHPILLIVGIVFIVLGVAVVAEDHVIDHRNRRDAAPYRHRRRW